jgi:RNA polymerase sigma-70 factor, ECF subfamily
MALTSIVMPPAGLSIRLPAIFSIRGTVVSMSSAGSPHELSDLLTRISAGDQTAFADFYDSTARTVFGIVLSVVRDHAQAEEVTQEVYVEAWTSAPRFDPRLGSAKGWLNTIAHRKAVDRVRSSQRSQERDQRHFEAGPVQPQVDTSDIVVAEDQSKRVRAALEQLPEAQRTALRMAYFEGRSYREVAEFLGLPLGTVKTRIRDAMKRLRSQLEEAAS